MLGLLVLLTGPARRCPVIPADERVTLARQYLATARQRDIDMPPPRRCSGTPAGSP